ncbi:MAG: lysoplasmalogenase [Blastocatellia bacterium]
MTAAARSFGQRFKTADWLLIGLSLVCGIAYFMTRGVGSFPGSVVIKGLSVSPLALIALRQLVGSDRLLMAGALLLSAAGDVFLGLQGEQWFTYGLGSFLVAHLFFITLFVRNWPQPFSASTARKSMAALLVAFAAAMFVWLWPSLGAMKLPVAVYMFALTSMGVTATLADLRAWWVAAGAALFMFSDSLIAIGKFKAPVDYGDYLIWATYCVAQACIALGFIREKPRA